MFRDIYDNPVMLTDCYNTSHQELKINTDFEVSHMYNRGLGMILYGIQDIATNILSRKITKENVIEAAENAKRLNIVFPYDAWMKVVDRLDGYLPLHVQTLPEGTWCPTGTPFAQIRNTTEGYGELVTWFEGVLMHAYFASGCATEAFMMARYLNTKGLSINRFHSFGFRGHRSMEDAYWAGTAWSMFLAGTDDFHIAKHMHEDIPMSSISALAHKVTQQYDVEKDCFIRAIDKAAENGKFIVALVIDTYNSDNVIENMVVELTAYARSKGVFVVWRPDSGNVKGQAVRIYTKLKIYGIEDCGAVIIGESMTFANIVKYDAYFEKREIPLSFINYGVGAGFYKHIERDTHGWAMKTAFSNGAPRMKLVKDSPFKQSIPNIVHLTIDGRGHMIVNDGDGDGLYELVYIDGKREHRFVKENTKEHFVEVRDRALKQDVDSILILSNETKLLIEEARKKYIGE